jgi:hypothetical protein
MKWFNPTPGDKFEFMSDRQTDKGPCTGTVLAVEGGSALMSYSDTTKWHDPEEIDVQRITTCAKDGKKLFILT